MSKKTLHSLARRSKKGFSLVEFLLAGVAMSIFVSGAFVMVSQMASTREVGLAGSNKSAIATAQAQLSAEGVSAQTGDDKLGESASKVNDTNSALYVNSSLDAMDDTDGLTYRQQDLRICPAVYSSGSTGTGMGDIIGFHIMDVVTANGVATGGSGSHTTYSTDLDNSLSFSVTDQDGNVISTDNGTGNIEIDAATDIDFSGGIDPSLFLNISTENALDSGQTVRYTFEGVTESYDDSNKPDLAGSSALTNETAENRSPTVVINVTAWIDDGKINCQTTFTLTLNRVTPTLNISRSGTDTDNVYLEDVVEALLGIDQSDSVGANNCVVLIDGLPDGIASDQYTLTNTIGSTTVKEEDYISQSNTQVEFPIPASGFTSSNPTQTVDTTFVSKNKFIASRDADGNPIGDTSSLTAVPSDLPDVAISTNANSDNEYSDTLTVTLTPDNIGDGTTYLFNEDIDSQLYYTYYRVDESSYDADPDGDGMEADGDGLSVTNDSDRYVSPFTASNENIGEYVTVRVKNIPITNNANSASLAAFLNELDYKNVGSYRKMIADSDWDLEWNLAGGGDWSVGTNWWPDDSDLTPPDKPGVNVLMGNGHDSQITEDLTVTLDNYNDWTVEHLYFDGHNQFNYTIESEHSGSYNTEELVMDDDGSMDPTITVISGSKHTIDSTISIQDPLTINLLTDSKLYLQNIDRNNDDKYSDIEKLGRGTMEFYGDSGSNNQIEITISGGDLIIGRNSNISSNGKMVVLNGGTLDLNNYSQVSENDMLVSQNSYLDFGEITEDGDNTSTFDIPSLSITPGKYLYIYNWQRGQDHFYLRNGFNIDIANRIIFVGEAIAGAIWDEETEEVFPREETTSTGIAHLIVTEDSTIDFHASKTSKIRVESVEVYPGAILYVTNFTRSGGDTNKDRFLSFQEPEDDDLAQISFNGVLGATKDQNSSGIWRIWPK